MNFPLSDEHRQQVITVLWFWWTCWRKSSGGQQGCDSRCDVKLMNSLRRSFLFQITIFIKTVLIANEARCEDFSFCSWNVSIIRSSSNRQPDQWRDDESSSSVLMNSSTSQLQFRFCVLCRDWQHYCVNSDILYGIVSTLFSRLEYCITLWLSTLFSRLGYCITLWLTAFLAD